MKNKKVLFIGGIKSGKSILAQKYAKKHAKNKPYYLATTEFFDKEMKKRINKHKKQRKDSFITVEEPLQISKTISACKDIVLIECIGMWINNMLFHGFGYKHIKKQIKNILSQDISVVFVMNDVGASVIANDKLTRKFVDINGKISQLITKHCDEAFYITCKRKIKIK